MKRRMKRMMKPVSMIVAIAMTFTMLGGSAAGAEAPVPGSLKAEAQEKLQILKRLMVDAQKRNLDVTREETVVWMSEQFLKFADWDEDHEDINAKLYNIFAPFKGQGEKLADELPDFERSEVNLMLEDAIAELTDVMSGEIQRKPAPKVNWNGVELQGSNYISNGRPVFLYDYFSKPLNQSTLDPGLYNDHLGNIDRPKSLNVTMLDPEGNVRPEKLADLIDRPNRNAGHLYLWHSSVNSWWGFDEQWESVWGEGAGPDMRIGKTKQFGDYDIDNPAVRQIWDRLFDQVIPVTKGQPYTKLGYMLFNEPHWYTADNSWFSIPNGVSEYTMEKFRTWLQEKHSTIASVNKQWNTTYSSFNEVTVKIPISADLIGTPMWYDWCRFNMERVTEWHTFLNDGIVRNDPEAKSHMKIMTKVFIDGYRDHGIDLEALTEMAGMIGDDAKIDALRGSEQPYSWESDYAFYWQEMFMSYDFMHSVAPEKSHINTELHSLSTSQFRQIDMKPEYVRSTFWLATLLGMDASTSWFWGRNADGSIEQRLIDAADQPGGLGRSYAASVAQQPRAANELTQTMYDMNAFSEEMADFQEQRKPIRVFYSETSAINNNKYIEDLYELYGPMVFHGVPIGFATKNILEKQDHSAWDTVVIRKTEQVTDAEFNAIQMYLNQGGSVIMDSQSLKKDEYGQPRNTLLKQGKGSLTLVADGAVDTMSELAFTQVRSEDQPGVQLSENNGGLKKGSFWRVLPQDDGSYVMTIVNMGKNPSEIQLSLEGGQPASVVDMMTGTKVSSSFTMKPEEVLLLEVRSAYEEDLTPPVTSDDAPEGWSKSNVTVSLQAADEGSGVAATYYSINGANAVEGSTVKLSEEGIHTLKYWSVDQAGNKEIPIVKTIRIDKTAPELHVELSETVLSPPNHRMVPVKAKIHSSDALSDVKVVLHGITSSEPDNGLGDGDQGNDIRDASLNTYDLTFSLRAERSGIGKGRTYTVTYKAVDEAGNETLTTSAVKVPHSSSGKK